MLQNYLRVLLSRFYSKKDSAEVIALRDVNVTPITLKDESINGASDVSVVAPASGRVVSYVNNNTGYNGLSYPGNMVTLISTFNPELINNTAMTFEVAKGQTFFVHRKTSSPTPCRVLLFPFNEGGGNSILNQILQGGLLCLRNTCKLYLTPSLVRQRTINCLVKPFVLSYKHQQKKVLSNTLQRRVTVLLQSMLGAVETLALETKRGVLGVAIFGGQTLLPVISEEQSRVTKGNKLLQVGRKKVDHQLSMGLSTFNQKTALGNFNLGGALC